MSFTVLGLFAERKTEEVRSFSTKDSDMCFFAKFAFEEGSVDR